MVLKTGWILVDVNKERSIIHQNSVYLRNITLRVINDVTTTRDGIKLASMTSATMESKEAQSKKFKYKQNRSLLSTLNKSSLTTKRVVSLLSLKYVQKV